jgi:general secretion pathway protein D
MFRIRFIGSVALATALAGCSTLPQPRDDGAMQREAMAGTEKPVPLPTPTQSGGIKQSSAVLPEMSAGTGEFIHPQALATPRPAAGGEGSVVFNFENQPVEAVVKAILGDLLHENYSIVPGVQGNISFSTSQPVTSEQALPILETLLSWTGNALIHKNGRYVVMPAKDAIAGNLVPSLGAAAPAGGLQARLFPLRFIAAGEMQKLIKPFARPDSILLADPTRNLIVMAGTSDELADYQRMVSTFDVDWLRGMSVGVFSLQRADVNQLMPELDKLFGAKGDTPMAGMLRFIPIERTNALVVITPQPAYLDEVRGWIERIDRGGGNEQQLYVYDVRNVQASDLASYLGDIYGSGSGGGSHDKGGKVGPGLSSGTYGAGNSGGSASGMGSNAGSFGSSGGSAGGLGSSPGGSGSSGGGLAGSGQGGNSAMSLGNDNGSASSSKGAATTTTDEGVRITAVDGNNQLLVRARPSQWAEIESAIKRLDSSPMQVQIETRIMEVSLTGQFQFGVQWFLEGLIGGDGNGSVGQPGNQQQIALGGGTTNYNNGSNGSTPDNFFYAFKNSNLQVAIHAVEVSGNSKTLSKPSLVVMNNQVAHIRIGDSIPVNQSFIVPGITSTADTPSTLGQVTYLDTGVILDVRPRVNPGGLVYMDVAQTVSKPNTSIASTNGNQAISTRELKTQIAVQSGQTVLLGGLISQDEATTNTGIPGLNSIPVLGRLFGTTSRSRNRTELILLITPHVITNGNDAKQITDEYKAGFESLQPIDEKPQASKGVTVTPARP